MFGYLLQYISSNIDEVHMNSMHSEHKRQYMNYMYMHIHSVLFADKHFFNVQVILKHEPKGRKQL